MSTIRQKPAARTVTLRLASGDQIPSHRHDAHQIVYAGRGVLAVTTDKASPPAERRRFTTQRPEHDALLHQTNQ